MWFLSIYLVSIPFLSHTLGPPCTTVQTYDPGAPKQASDTLPFQRCSYHLFLFTNFRQLYSFFFPPLRWTTRVRHASLSPASHRLRLVHPKKSPPGVPILLSFFRPLLQVSLAWNRCFFSFFHPLLLPTVGS
ncbi:hypothetical protein LY78DRAFT_87462 [Colletotrichum sublineola]|nr:hypothetical protein LY78DRAFT_87462 [Colletotrichum sublineola]